jgi:hypothetical protein
VRKGSEGRLRLGSRHGGNRSRPVGARQSMGEGRFYFYKRRDGSRRGEVGRSDIAEVSLASPVDDCFCHVLVVYIYIYIYID